MATRQAKRSASNQILGISDSAWDAIPVGAVLEFSANPNPAKFAPLDGRWVKRSSCPQLSALLPHPQPDPSLIVGTAPAATLNKVQYIPETGLWFLLSTSATASIYSSSNGITWNTITMPSSTAWSQIVYCRGLGMYLAVGVSPNYATSTDLVNWTPRTFAAAYTNPTVGANSSRFVMLSNSNTEAYYSDNGISWSTVSFPVSVNISYVQWLNGRFIVMASSTTTQPVIYSTDGATWTACGVVPNLAYGGVAWNGSKYFLFPSTITGTSAYYTSTDLSTWVTFAAEAVPSSVSFRWAEWNNGVLLLATSSYFASSENGVIWRHDLWQDGLSAVVHARTNGAGRMVAVMNTGSTYGYTNNDQTLLYLPMKLPSLTGLKAYIRVDGPVVYA